MRRIFIAEFRSSRDPTIWQRLECVNCGWDMSKQPGAFLGDAEHHLCPIEKRTLDMSEWRAIARDAFLDGRDAEAIAIIGEMEPQRYQRELERAFDVGRLRNALKEAIEVIENMRSPSTLYASGSIARWRKIGGL
jgi:hypothetical protein